MLPLSWTPSFSQHSFCTGASNAQAWSLMHQSHWPSRIMWLYGPEGSGKTHLATLWAHSHSARWINPQCQQGWGIYSLACNSHYLVVDSLSPQGMNWESDGFTDLSLLAFLKEIKDRNIHCLILSRRAPTHWPSTLLDLTSRMNAIASVQITLPDESLWCRVLRKTFHDISTPLSPFIISFLWKRLPRSFHSIQQLLALSLNRLPGETLSLLWFKNAAKQIDAQTFSW